jgi:hypothetical protein
MKQAIVIRALRIGVVCLLSACAGWGTKGVVSIGPDLYMVGRLGKFTDFSSSAVKARLFQEADQFCKAKDRVMVPVASTGKDSDLGTYASAEVQFSCLLASDPRASKSGQ